MVHLIWWIKHTVAQSCAHIRNIAQTFDSRYKNQGSYKPSPVCLSVQSIAAGPWPDWRSGNISWVLPASHDGEKKGRELGEAGLNCNWIPKYKLVNKSFKSISIFNACLTVINACSLIQLLIALWSVFDSTSYNNNIIDPYLSATKATSPTSISCNQWKYSSFFF